MKIFLRKTTYMLVLWTALGFISLLTGCRFSVPSADSGVVQYFHYDSHPALFVSESLSSTQISELATWISNHRDRWEYKITDLPLETFVVLKDHGRVVAGINIGESFIYANSWYRQITDTERKELAAIVLPLTQPFNDKTLAH